MGWNGLQRSAVVAWACALTSAVMVTVAPASAHAFELKHTSSGEAVHWPSSSVHFVVDSSVSKAASGGADAVTRAAQAWSGASGAPTLATSSGSGATQPAVDGTNTVLYAPHGFAPAGDALAITVLSFDEKTGEIVDADVVINGVHSFAVLAPGATAPLGAVPVSTEGVEDDAHGPHQVFDLQHVMAHEVGHTLGLADDASDKAALMYPYTVPGDASVRAPAEDDLNGMDALYGGAPSSSSAHGCGANVAGGRVRDHDAWAGMLLVVAFGAWLASRRSARTIVPVGAACFALLAGTGDARSSPSSASAVQADAHGHVVGVSVRNNGGILETVLDVQPVACARASRCPERVEAHAWGGTVNGITQIVGDQPAPRVGDEVDVAFSGSMSDPAPVASVVAAHSPLSGPRAGRTVN